MRRKKSKQNQRHDGRRYLAAAIVTAWQKALSVRPAYLRQQIGLPNPHSHAPYTGLISNSASFASFQWTRLDYQAAEMLGFIGCCC